MAEASPLDWLSGQAMLPGAPLSEQIYWQLRFAIVTGRIEPAAVIQDPLVAQHFGVSRTPVREALLRLRDDGLVVIRKQAGTFVAPIDPARVEEGMLVREALEPRVVEVSTSRMSGHQLADLDAETQLMSVSAEAGDGPSFIAADDRFHLILIEAGGFPHIAEIIGRVNAQLDRVRHLSSTDRTRARTAVREHRAIIKSLRAGDGPGSAEQLRRHLEGSWRLIRKIVAEKIGDKAGRTELV